MPLRLECYGIIVLVTTFLLVLMSEASQYTYIYSSEKRSWNEAQQICANYGGRLARITSLDVQNDFNSFFSSGGVWEGHPEHDYWIGLTVFDSGSGGRSAEAILNYLWSDCTGFDDANTFLTIEDKSKMKYNEHCMKVKQSDGSLKFKKCDGKRPFICEVPSNDSCIYTTEFSGTVLARSSTPVKYCTAECSRKEDCPGVLTLGDTCFLLSSNESLSTENNFTYVQKNCEQGFLLTDPDDSGVQTNNDEIPLLPCYAALNLSQSSEIYSSSVAYSFYPSFSQVVPSSTIMTAIDISDVTRIAINSINLSGLECALEVETAALCQPGNSSVLFSSLLATASLDYSLWSACSESYFLRCNSSKTNSQNRTIDDEIKEIVKHLTVEPESTLAYQSQFQSAEDSRPSSRIVGSVGAVFIAIPLALIILSDLPRYYAFFKLIYRFYRKYKQRKDVKLYVKPVTMPQEPDLFAGAVPIYSSDATLSSLDSMLTSDTTLILSDTTLISSDTTVTSSDMTLVTDATDECC